MWTDKHREHSFFKIRSAHRGSQKETGEYRRERSEGCHAYETGPAVLEQWWRGGGGMVGGSPVPLTAYLKCRPDIFFVSHCKSLEIWHLLTWRAATFYDSCVTPGTRMWQQGVNKVRGTPVQSAAASWEPFWSAEDEIPIDFCLIL